MSSSASNLKTNVRQFYYNSFFGGWAFATGFLVFHYRQLGFSFVQILIVAILYEALNFLLEIPSGVLADLWSRKWTITLGHAISGLSFLVIIIRPEAYWMYLLWSVLSAICTTLNSGTVTATLYDSLRAVGREGDFVRIQGHMNALGLTTRAVCFILGGFLADMFGFRLVLLLSGVGGILQAIVLSQLVEPAVHADESRGKPDRRPVLERFALQVRSSFRSMFDRASIRWVIGYSTLGFVVIELQQVIAQPYLVSLGFDSRFAITLFTSSFALSTALAALVMGRIRARLGEFTLLVLISAGIGVPLLVLGLSRSLVGVVALFVFNASVGAASVVLPDMLNQLIPSNKRATILSAQNQFASVGYIVFGVALGGIMDARGLAVGSLVVGATATVLFSLFLLRRRQLRGE
jgi:MFS family permease